MTRTIGLATATLLMLAAQAQARCAGTPRDPLTPDNPHCSVDQFLNPSFGRPMWYSENSVARNSMIQDCTRASPYYGWQRPPAAWCAAAMSAGKMSR